MLGEHELNRANIAFRKNDNRWRAWTVGRAGVDWC
jgi:hypothetical protein